MSVKRSDGKEVRGWVKEVEYRRIILHEKIP
jgi:hypothetical protein